MSQWWADVGNLYIASLSCLSTTCGRGSDQRIRQMLDSPTYQVIIDRKLGFETWGFNTICPTSLGSIGASTLALPSTR